MNMTPRNIAVTVIAAMIGVYLGQKFPLVGLIALIGGLGFAFYVLLANKQGQKLDDATRSAALNMTPNEGMARIYVARQGFMGGMQGMNILIDDGLYEGQFRSGNFMVAELTPGPHKVSAKFHAQTASSQRHHAVNLSAGECVLLELGFDMGAVQGKISFAEQRDKRTIVQQLGTRRMISWLRQP